MERIASFNVDHTVLPPGMYLSREDGDVATYDLRFCRPNAGRYIDNPSLHTVEHLFATFARNSAFGGSVIYFGPMGCRTGFYFLLRAVNAGDAIALVREATALVAGYDGDVPGCSEGECGNCREHDLSGARAWASGYLSAIQCWTEDMLAYPSAK